MKTINIDKIQEIIPHRFPFLLVDKAELTDDPLEIIGYKCVTMNEWFFQGHYPKYPIMPGVLILESLAQVFCILLLSNPKYNGKIPMLIKIEEAKYRNQVRPGDVMKLYIKVLHEGSKAGKVYGSVEVDNKLVMDGQFKYVVVDHKRS